MLNALLNQDQICQISMEWKPGEKKGEGRCFLKHFSLLVALGSNAKIDLLSSTNEILSISALYERTDTLHQKLQLQSKSKRLMWMKSASPLQ